jgi:hypothetical protein
MSRRITRKRKLRVELSQTHLRFDVKQVRQRHARNTCRGRCLAEVRAKSFVQSVRCEVFFYREMRELHLLYCPAAVFVVASCRVYRLVLQHIDDRHQTRTQPDNLTWLWHPVFFFEPRLTVETDCEKIDSLFDSERPLRPRQDLEDPYRVF